MPTIVNESSRVLYVEKFAQDNRQIQQFGQWDDEKFYGGRTACAAACLQFIIKLWLGRTYTLDQIATIAGYPANYDQRIGRIGMTTIQISRVISRLGLPYKFVARWTNVELMRRTNLYGPSLIAYRYGTNPEWYGYNYGGVRADGRPNGFASPLGRAGKTQLTGFENGSHMGIHLGYLVIRNSSGGVTGRHHRFKDPNHGSPSRPEKPPFDVISDPQFKRLAASLTEIGRTPFAYVATRALIK